MSPQPTAFSAFPSVLSLSLKLMVCAGGLLLFGLGSLHSYRRVRGFPFAREKAEAERLRDELVFGEEDAKALGVPEDPTPFVIEDLNKTKQPS